MMAADQAFLLAKGLSCQRDETPLFEPVDLTLAPGQLVLLEGENGVGKTTLLRTLSGLKQASSGSAQWSGEHILGKKPENLVRHGISHVSEGKSVIPELTVKENLALGGIWRKDKKDVAAVTKEVLDLERDNLLE